MSAPAGAKVVRSRYLELVYLSRATLVSLAVTSLEIWSLPWVASNMPTWLAFFAVQILATLASFVGNKYWSFEAGKHGALHVQGGKQVVVFVGSWALNTGIPSLLAYRFGFSTRWAFTISNVFVYLCWNYPMIRFWIFRHPSMERPPHVRG